MYVGVLDLLFMVQAAERKPKTEKVTTVSLKAVQKKTKKRERERDKCLKEAKRLQLSMYVVVK